ncbi:AI-2E family transporter [Macrococcus hajekii]|uniref:AI-2E family transporter n=1 Tax=Macrococcus hajekii TaxID=198482 RepID=A0A4R6BNV4_9STAP|nr:AI-2E family transporter [Macrococcus hajekii]TDM03402.1 AI-2E family transporter [Macrococcus hajekii]GGA98587.1 AI-2E family transporter [Macrococcus hajekii]
MFNKVWFRVAVTMLLVFLIIKYFLEINHIFYPLVVIFSSVALPLVLGGFLYYIMVPFQNFLEKKRNMPRWKSLLIIILLMVVLIATFVMVIGPLLAGQITNFIQNFPTIQKEFQSYVSYALDQRDKLPVDVKTRINDAISQLSDMAGNLMKNSVQYVTTFVSTLFLLILVPFFLIYMLKDHDKFIPFIASKFTGRRKKFVVTLFTDIDRTLRSYIQGQVTVSIILGTLLLIGYLVIGLDYALVLALWGMVTNLIPFLGPYLAVIPAMVIALIQDPLMVVYVIIIMTVAQQLEGNVITPNIMGKTLNIHPLTIITVILAAGNLGGFVAILVAVPTYAVLKTIVTNIYHHRQAITMQATKTVKEEHKKEVGS